MNPKLSNSPSAARVLEMATRVSRVAGASATLVAHMLGNVERMVTDLVADSTEVARESEVLYTMAAQHAASVQAAIRATPRFTRVVSEVLRVVAAYRLHQAKASLVPSPRADSQLQQLHEQSAERLYQLCVELRGGVLKLGQFASSRLDLLPAPYITALSRLQDQVPAVPTEDIVRRVEEELGAPLEQLFASFEEQPLAAASLAQVHGATLADGTRVAVKVQVPGIQQTVEIDLAAFRVIAATLRDIFPQVDLDTIAGELTRCVREELDYELEAERARAFGCNFADNGDIIVPAIHPRLCSTRVLTMERVDGQRLTGFLDQCAQQGEEGAARSDRLMAILIRSFCIQVLEHGLFQADPHPGNFLVCDGPRLALLDFGAVQVFPPPLRAAYGRVAGAILQRDSPAIVEQLEALGFRTRNGDPDALLECAEMLLDTFRPDPHTPLSQVDPRAAFEQVLAVAQANPIVQVPQDFVLLGRVFATLGGLLMHYRPRINLFALLAPYLAPYLARPVQN